MNAWKKCVSLLLLALLTVALLCACDAESGTEKNDAPTDAPQAEESAPEDMLGLWYDPLRPRVSLTVTRTDDGDQVLIRWSSSAFQVYEWSFLGQYKGNRLISTNCKKSLITYTSESDFEEEVIYQDGSAALYFNADGKLCWDDGKENAGADCRFEKN